KLGTLSTAVLTIRDNDVAGNIQFSAPTYTVSENAASATITVRRTGGSASGVTVAYATAGGTATPGSDYLPVSGTLTFAAGETSKSFDVPLLHDNSIKGDRTVGVILSDVGGGASL